MQISPLQQIFAAAKAQATGGSSGDTTKTTGNPNQDLNNMFMQLLVAQLKSQSPLDPLDPNQFVAQLAQFNSLSELTQIRQILQQVLNS